MLRNCLTSTQYIHFPNICWLFQQLWTVKLRQGEKGLSCMWAWSKWLWIWGAEQRLAVGEQSLCTEWHVCVIWCRFRWGIWWEWDNPPAPWGYEHEHAWAHPHPHRAERNYATKPHQHKHWWGTAVPVCLILNDKVTWCPEGHLRGKALPGGHSNLFSSALRGTYSSRAAVISLHVSAPLCSQSLPVCLQVSTS